MNPTSSKNSSKQDCINPALLNTLDNPSRPSKSSVSSSSSPNHVSADYILQKGNDDRGDGLKRAEELLMRCESLSDLCECLEILVGNQPPMDVDTEVIDVDPLPSDLERRLVDLYFETVHMLCPVVEKHEFLNWYRNRSSLGPPEGLRSLVLQATVFAAFAHCSDQELSQSPYISIPEGQKHLFERVRRQYMDLAEKNEGSPELIQCALILSHWSPYDSSKDVNSFWADEAIHHARICELESSNDPQHRVIWWCCLTRNRILALALRRPHKLRAGCLKQTSYVDIFGKAWPTSSSLLSDLERMASILFVSLCKLSEYMNSIVLLRHSSSRWDDWRAYQTGSELAGTDINSIMVIDQGLGEWNADFEQQIMQHAMGKIPRQFRPSVYFLRLVYQGCLTRFYWSLRASLYEPYIGISHETDAASWLLNALALRSMKEAAFLAARQVWKMLTTTAVADIPLTVVAWLLLPAYVNLARLRSHPQWEDVLPLIQPVLYLLNRMSRRYTGVQHTVVMVESFNRAFTTAVEASTEANPDVLEMELMAQGRRILQESLALGVIVNTRTTHL